MENPKFQIFKSTSNLQYYFRLRAKNGEIILGSEGYTTKVNCQNGIGSVQRTLEVEEDCRRTGDAEAIQDFTAIGRQYRRDVREY